MFGSRNWRGIFYGISIFHRDYPKRRIGKQAAHQLRVQRVTSLVRLYTRQQWQSNKRKIANQIQRLVPAKFVVKTQWPVHNAFVREHDGILKRTTPNQAHRP